MNRFEPLLVLNILLGLAGAVISYNLLVKHVETSTGISWFDATCEATDEEESARSCDEVMASAWGTLPPVPTSVAPSKRYEPVSVLGAFKMRPRPVALFGMLYFTVMTAWYVAVGRPDYRRRYWQLLPLTLNILGVGGALFFSYIMFFTELQAWCPWCLVAHVCNGVMLVGSVLLWPRTDGRLSRRTAHDTSDGVAEGQGAKASTLLNRCAESLCEGTGVGCNPGCDGEVARRAEASAGHDTAHHPYGRLVFVVLLAVGALIAAEGYHYEYLSKARDHEQLRAAFAKLDGEMKQVRNHAKTLFSLFQASEKKDIPLRDDAPVKNPGPDHLVAVVISDFRCPHCARFAEYMKEVVEPMFDGHLAVTFKHFPADTTCNRHIRRTLHPKACLASAAAEAARTLGGADAFWRAHDLLFASQDRLRDGSFYMDLADRLGLDEEQFVEAWASEAVMERISEDIELAMAINLRGTPAVYIEGRHVPSLSREQDVFWKEISRRYEYRLRARRHRRTSSMK